MPKRLANILPYYRCYWLKKWWYSIPSSVYWRFALSCAAPLSEPYLSRSKLLYHPNQPSTLLTFCVPLFDHALSALALAAILVALTSASFIPFSVREITPADVVGSFREADSNGLGCPFRIEHTATVSEGSNVIPHSAIIHNRRVPCEEGEMTIYDDSQFAIDSVPKLSLATLLFIQTFDNMGEPAFYGIEKGGRTCGGTSFSAGTVVILFAPNEPLVFSNIKAFPGRRYMLIRDPGSETHICTYSADALTAPTPEPGIPDSDDDGGKGPGTGPGGKPRSTPKPSVTPSAGTSTPDPVDEDGSVCFPADAEVEIVDGNVKRISNIQVGDRVKVADGIYSDVFMLTHKNAGIVHDFMTLSTASGEKISATKGHYLYINGRFAAAVSAKVGDILELGNGAQTTIKRVYIEKKVGLFNPQTIHGDLIVNGIRASTFTRIVEPPTAQALLAPLRMVYGAVGVSVSFFSNGADSIAALLSKGRISL